MSWASRRETTRVEDKAYCLIGIFDISISVAYGEREAAFYRLQAEIMQHSGDLGLFHWEGEASARNGMLAVGPECFSRIEYDTEIAHHMAISDSTYALTNLGLRIWLRVYEPTDSEVHRASKTLANPELMDSTIGILAETIFDGIYLAVVLESTGNSRAQRYKKLGLIQLDLPPSVVPDREPIEIFIA